MSLSSDLCCYIEELYSISRVCERPTADGEKCVQCREKERVIDRLRSILLAEHKNSPYREQIEKQWPDSPQQVSVTFVTKDGYITPPSPSSSL